MLILMLIGLAMSHIVTLLMDIVFSLVTLISWSTKKQDIVSHSTDEAKYRVMAYTTSEVVCLASSLHNMVVFISALILLYCDNRSAIQIANNSDFHEQVKHIEADRHLVHHQYHVRTFSLPYMPTDLQIIDFFTKSQTIPRFSFYT